MQNATILFEKLYNFRDVGGMETEDGHSVKSGVLFRSDDISRLTKKDLDTFSQYEFKLICDLRTSNERKSKLYEFPKSWGIELKHVPIYHESQDLSHREFFQLLVKGSKNLDFEEMIKDFYRCMIIERRQEIKEVITLIANYNKAPCLIHCTGGKDRTGLITALIQLYLNVPYDKVIDHYLVSNALVGPRMKKIENFIRMMSLYRVSSQQIKPLLIVSRDYLEDVLQEILKEFGTVENYFIKGCGIDKNSLNKLRGFLLDK